MRHPPQNLLLDAAMLSVLADGKAKEEELDEAVYDRF